jgi:hypothetical protein
VRSSAYRLISSYAETNPLIYVKCRRQLISATTKILASDVGRYSLLNGLLPLGRTLVASRTLAGFAIRQGAWN